MTKCRGKYKMRSYFDNVLLICVFSSTVVLLIYTFIPLCIKHIFINTENENQITVSIDTIIIIFHE